MVMLLEIPKDYWEIATEPTVSSWNPEVKGNMSIGPNIMDTNFIKYTLNDCKKVDILPDSEQIEFDYWVDKWHEERAGMSSPDDIFNCASYKQILLLGRGIRKFILKRMEEEKTNPDFWFDALETIYKGFSPVDEEDAGDLKAINNKWLSWAKSNDL